MKKFDLSCGIEKVVGNMYVRKWQMIYGMVLTKRRRQKNVVVSCGPLFVILSHFQSGKKL
jgi:hypothetical protein